MVKCDGVTNSYTVPSIYILSSHSVPGMATGYGKCFLLHGRETIISCDLELFNFILLAVDKSDMCWISSDIDSEEAGTNR